MYRLHGAIHAYGATSAAPTARETADAVISALTPAAWYRNATDVVSSGGFASIWADYASGDKGLVLPGVAGNNASIPDAAYWPTGSIDARIRLQMSDWTPAGTVTFFAKNGGAGQVSFRLNLNTTGVLVFISSTDGTVVNVSVTSTASLTVSDGDALWVRVIRNSATGDVSFYQAADAPEIPASWTQVGTTVSVATGAMFDSTANVVVGDGSGALNARVYRFVMYSDLTETTKVLDADFSSQTIGAGSFTESSSNAATVTINASGAAPAHIGKARDLLQGTGTNQPAYASGIITGDGVDQYMKTSPFTLNQPTHIFGIFRQDAWTNTDHIFDGNTYQSGELFQSGTTPNLAIYAGTGTVAATNESAIGSWFVAQILFKGASSSVTIDANAPATGNAGAANMGGFTLLTDGIAGAYWSAASVAEVVIFSSEITGTDLTNLYNAIDGIRDAL